MDLSAWSAPVYDAGLVYVEKLRAAGITATNDPRSVTPPCVLVQHTRKDDHDNTDMVCGFMVSWQWMLVAPGPGNADALLLLERLDTAVRSTLSVRASTMPASYSSGENPPMPAYSFEFDEEIHYP